MPEQTVPSAAGSARPAARSKVARANTLRLMSLCYVLMSARQPVPRHQLFSLVEGYRGGPDDDQGTDDATLARMFERDKAILRESGITLETTTDADGQDGYRIPSRDFVLPEVDFSPEERAMLAMAGRVWSDHALAEESRQGLAKLAATGIELDDAPGRSFQPSLSASEQAFFPLLECLRARQAVRFGYRSGEGQASERTIEPWVLGQRGGSWYVSGYDRDRLDQRSFKLSRVTTTPLPVGAPGAYVIPEGVDAGRVLASLGPGSGDQVAVLAIRGEYAPALRRRGTETRHTDTPEGYRAWQVTYLRGADLVSELATFGADVLVLHPPELRAAMVEHLRRVVAAHGDPTGGQAVAEGER